MHDGLAQAISSIHLKTEYLKTVVNSKNLHDKNDLNKLVNTLSEIANDAYDEVRQNLFNLKVTNQPDLPLISMVKNYCEKFETYHYIKVNVNIKNVNEDTLPIPNDTKLHVFRIIQEALSNAKKHSQGTKIKLSIECFENNHCRLTIEDNGIGFDLKQKSLQDGHYGLRTMKERASLIDGGLTIESDLKNGTKIQLMIPLRGVQNGQDKNTSL
jgi:signal transduction histidine kinase